MLTRIATAALAITLLGASALALSPLDPVKGPAPTAAAAAPAPAGVTVIEKNSAWPLKHYMSMDPCTVAVCQEA